MVKEERRRELAAQRVTLDGKDAVVSGVKADFAMIRQLNGYGFEWSWDTVDHVITDKNGEFRS